MELKDRLTALLKARKVTAHQFGIDSGLGIFNVMGWAKGRRKPNADASPLLAEALGVNDKWLRTGRGPKWRVKK